MGLSMTRFSPKRSRRPLVTLYLRYHVRQRLCLSDTLCKPSMPYNVAPFLPNA